MKKGENRRESVREKIFTLKQQTIEEKLDSRAIYTLPRIPYAAKIKMLGVEL